MMLTEHVELLRELESSQNKVKRPVPHMSQIEDMEMVISEAMKFNNPVQLFQPLPFLNSFQLRGFKILTTVRTDDSLLA
ncbi:YolD-like family protein [Bacillus paralicheniformis]|uniref:YolD-like family protein n=1 Tax=Bacillus paralicheniformis TaxID=1648923 RepID=UPI001645A11F|nr:MULTISPECIES: YolD-like family protein [Bacillus]WMW46468.1 YolD-like family protein [Bacillus paralicheniformis]